MVMFVQGGGNVGCPGGSTKPSSPPRSGIGFLAHIELGGVTSAPVAYLGRYERAQFEKGGQH
jgi:hypothetical protein